MKGVLDQWIKRSDIKHLLIFIITPANMYRHVEALRKRDDIQKKKGKKKQRRIHNTHTHREQTHTRTNTHKKRTSLGLQTEETRTLHARKDHLIDVSS